MESAIFSLADRLHPVVSRSRIYVDGLDRLPRDGRFLLVGNHTTAGWPEIVLIPYFVHAELGVRVRGLATRQLADMGGLGGEIAEAAGAVVGDPATAAELMIRGETVLVFPGGGRDMLKFKGEEYRLLWQGRSGFARLAIAHDYPIVPVGLVGGDDVFHSMTERDGAWERMTRGIGERLHGVRGVGIPLVRGIGPTFAPRPQRMYLRFGAPIATERPTGTAVESWERAVKQTTQNALESILDEVQTLRAEDPFRRLNPLAWRSAIQPPPAQTA
ncbi:lysophospholipid acyltransferase family protein [Mycobacterium sp. PSTR-4-N]|uniref:lysophospholipid acyltransferase family protein n=1 Tax=Mycobacterium sp. PSTR-4-N TaxID=2917745 RepID=UPI001F149EF6|nr:acyltransferase family protein [Mycobacterium sp. PSTR-4-N]